MKWMLGLMCLFAPYVGWGQVQQQVLTDTSFTVYSAFVKARKTNPDITIVAAILPKGVKAARNIVYCSPGGRDLQLDVFYPDRKSTGRYQPAILIIHGGGWRSGNRAQQEPMAVWLAAKGYVAITVQYRLSREAKYPAAVNDLQAAVRWIHSKGRAYGIDTNKIAIAGCSAGGQLAALIGTTTGEAATESQVCNAGHSRTVQAIIDIDGILAFVHPESGEGDERKGPSAATLWFGETKEEKRSAWEAAGALNHVSATTPPVLFINSGVARMHAGRNDMIQKLDSLHIYSEVHTFADAPHPFWLFTPWFEPMMQYIQGFLHTVF